jgi:hypothetical protein
LLALQVQRLTIPRFLAKDDKRAHRFNDAFINKQINLSMSKSPAGQRAIEVMTYIEIDRLSEELRPLPHPNGDEEPEVKVERYNRARDAKENTLPEAKRQLEFIAYQMVADGEEPSCDILGARFLAERLPEYVGRGGSGSYTKLRVGELRELLRLRGRDVEGLKVELIE